MFNVGDKVIIVKNSDYVNEKMFLFRTGIIIRTGRVYHDVVIDDRHCPLKYDEIRLYGENDD